MERQLAMGRGVRPAARPRKPMTTRGGIEFGFLSATADAELAMTYAADAPSEADSEGRPMR